MKEENTNMETSDIRELKITTPVFTWVYQNGVQVSANENEFKKYLRKIICSLTLKLEKRNYKIFNN